MLMPIGLLCWLAIGLVAGLGARMLPGKPPLGQAQAILIGLGGAVLGGLLATVLDFGGLAAFDARALVTAALSAVLCLLLLRTLTLV